MHIPVYYQKEENIAEFCDETYINVLNQHDLVYGVEAVYKENKESKPSVVLLRKVLKPKLSKCEAQVIKLRRVDIIVEIKLHCRSTP